MRLLHRATAQDACHADGFALVALDLRNMTRWYQSPWSKYVATINETTYIHAGAERWVMHQVVVTSNIDRLAKVLSPAHSV